jgi:hypothetical protein
VDSGFCDWIYWTSPVVTTIIHFKTLQRTNQRLYPLSSLFRTALPGTRIFTSVFLARCFVLSVFHNLPYSVYLSASVSQSQSYFMTGTIPPISSSWRRAPWDSQQEFFFSPKLNTCGHSPYITSSLVRGSVCHLQLLLALASAFSGPIPEGLTNIFYCLRYDASPFVAFYNSQGYGGGIRPSLHKGNLSVIYQEPS